MRLNQGNSLKTLASMKASVSVLRAAWGVGGGGYSVLNLPGCVSMKVMDMGLFFAPSE